mmetsp:Transcript_108562/g.259152  ORF Transcript_108562/g.259152 Transcript_108562/m.259152 type:complete len:326 (-) Transcript_108562:1678-2655(-)
MLELRPLRHEARLLSEAEHLGVAPQGGDQRLAVCVADTHLLHCLLEDRLRHRPAALRRYHPSRAGRVHKAPLLQRCRREDLIGLVFRDNLPNLFGHIAEHHVGAIPLGEDGGALVRTGARVGAFRRTQAIHDDGPGTRVLAAVQILAVRHESLHIVLEADLSMDLNLLVDAHIVLVPDDRHVGPHLAVRHAGPGCEGPALEGGRLVGKVWTEVEAGAALERHRRVHRGALRDQIRPEARGLLLVPDPVRGEPNRPGVDVHGHAHHHVLVQRVGVLRGHLPIPVPGQFLAAVPSEGVLAIHCPAVLVISHAPLVARSLGRDDEVVG